MDIASAKSAPAVQQSRRILRLFAGVHPSTFPRYLFAVVVTLAASGYVAAQADINEAHILPRAMPVLC